MLTARRRAPTHDGRGHVEQRVSSHQPTHDPGEQRRVVRHGYQHEQIPSRDLHQIQKQNLETNHPGANHATPAALHVPRDRLVLRRDPPPAKRREILHAHADGHGAKKSRDHQTRSRQRRALVQKRDARRARVAPPLEPVHVHGYRRDVLVAEPVRVGVGERAG